MILVILSCAGPIGGLKNTERSGAQVRIGNTGRRDNLRITVKLYSDLRVYQRNRPDPFEIDLPDCADVTALIRTLEIDPLKHEIIVGVNGELGRPDSSLAEGDEVMLVTPMQGGLGTREGVLAR